MIQCATCMFEMTAIDALHPLWEDQQTFNRWYGFYQNLARKYQCSDYMKAWCNK